ncbi:MAG: NAD-dependent epimerase/dehydratase family protein, partial [bacterium]|nr:NAD-dependent epimerase/dehydratase family protein [bacterium]
SLSRREGCDFDEVDSLIGRLAELKPEVVVNCGAQVGSVHHVSEKAADVVDANMRMQLNIFKALREAAPEALLINPIANCAYPGYLEVYSEDRFWEGPLHPSVLSYGSTRRMMMVLSECYGWQYNLHTINLLVPNMYGPYDSPDPNKAHALNALAAKVVKAAREESPTLDVWGTGIAIREWLYAGDFARIVVEAIERPGDRCLVQPLNVGQRRGYTVREIVELIVAEAGYPGEVRWDASKPEGAPRKIMDDGLFRAAFPRFRFTLLQDGIRATLRYYSDLYPYHDE